MDYGEAVGFLNSFTKAGAPVGDLSRFRRLCGRLGDPQERLSFLHVAGTNGKGSACAYLDGALRAAGLKTGCFTSPYLVELRERIRLDGEMIGEADFAEAMSRVKEAADSPELSQFELLTAAAFLFYDRVRADAVVLETGIGGLYDCTALVKPEISVITRIDYDHCAILGRTLPEIAAHKAGIIKPGVPAVSSPDQAPEALAVLKKRAAEIAAPFVEADGAALKITKNTLYGTEFLYREKRFTTKMGGAHQPENAAAAIEALRLMKIPERAIEAGLAAVLPARMQVYSQNPLIVVDGGHNPSGTAAAAALLDAAGLRPRMVIGTLGSKDWEKALPPLLAAADDVIFTDSFSPVAVPAETLSSFAKGLGVSARAIPDTDRALYTALAAVRREAPSPKKEDGVFIGGSLYLAGYALGKFASRSIG
ncbi:MAG: bifunctional folylpolyglutamate synthase/dihydrofolate synthase [Bacteroides sp.]|nr:bifunctional folylpolyglutamate synthase/dihydrofolate synthase [Eubacterium sp.]MCM1418483.1 bifunctional folylpolyglutamate synthase/dihydrofolate synthase [Roseburia sp.]MCM1462502.1 bifunctional folylpolyglutamate synthase/dihydrofolate synthase [Bacteroides sp.]